ncbi:hypothetical protein PMAYCL1PPCAC_16463, partial [Pristionchus mayeri]
HIIIASAGIISMTTMEWNRKVKKRMAHRSLFLLMEMHSFWTFLLCLTTLYHKSATLYAHLTMRDHSELLADAITCSIRRGAVIVSVYGSIFSQMAMALERYHASQNLATY